MNVYIYGGADRNSANERVTPNNEQVKVGKKYSIDATHGFLIVVYPNKEVDT
jgi:hypothetical protein